jgi:Flp pilus assembly protein TadB
MDLPTSHLRDGLFFALCALAISLVVIKLLTGLALVPLAVIGMFVFVFALGLKLRMDRGSDRQYRRRSPRQYRR